MAIPNRVILTDVNPIIRSLEAEPVFTGKWAEIQWQNTPGPFYGAQTDNCCTGPGEAPNNVATTTEGYEYIFRQPVNLYEAKQVIQAACVDPWGGYGCDGNAHWTYEKVKVWWSRHRELEAEINWIYEHQDNYFFTNVSLWKEYFNNGLPAYLRAYSFFLLEQRWPIETDTLPTL